jgi:uncharacterized integral membrane protein
MADDDGVHRPGEAGRGTDLAKRLVGPVIIALAVLLFVAQNKERQSFSFLVFDFDAPLWLMLAVTALLGIAIGWFLKRRSVRR